MANRSVDPVAAAADLSAALDAFQADLASLPSIPIPLQQDAFSAFYHS